MHTLNFSIEIAAPVEKVWDSMLSDTGYREWTQPFAPGSYYKGNWETGSKILFLGPNKESGGEGGMVSRIAENKLHEFISIEHVGFIKDGVEDTTSEEVKKWVPAHENYTFTKTEMGTKVSVAVDIAEEYKNMFEDMWPQALQILKEIAERE